MHATKVSSAKLNKLTKERNDLERYLYAFVSTAEDYLMPGQFSEMLEAIDSKHSVIGVSTKEVITWWQKHKENDKRRLEAEKKTAIAKLTPYERKILGLS